MRREVYDAALSEVNRVRVGRGEGPLSQLPSGRNGDDCRCPIAQALGCSVFLDGELRWDVEYEPDEDCDSDEPSRGVRVPAAIREFVNDFDEEADDESDVDPLTLVTEETR